MDLVISSNYLWKITKVAVLFACLMLVTLPSLVGCDQQSYTATEQVQCPDQQQPRNVTPGPTYITIVCNNGYIFTQRVSDYNDQYGSSYTSGQDMLADYFVWMWLLGPHYSSVPYYQSYIHTPAYTSYRPSTYVINNRTVYRGYSSPAEAFAARNLQVRSYSITRANSSWTKSYGSTTTTTYRSSYSYGGGYRSYGGKR